MPYKDPIKKNTNQRKRYHQNIEYRRKYNREFIRRHPEYRERQKENLKRYHKEHYNREESVRRCKERRIKIRIELFHLLGGKCVRCEESDVRCLQIDHVNGGGCKEARKLGRDYYSVYLKKIKSGSKDYQLLCANCQWRKRWENKEWNK